MARKTLDPFYQQLLAFKENCRGCILQVRYTTSLFFFFQCILTNSYNVILILLCMASGDSVG